MAQTELDVIVKELEKYTLFMTETEVIEATGLSSYTVQQKIPRADLKNRTRRYKKTDVINYYLGLKSCHQSQFTKESAGKKMGPPRPQKFTGRKLGSAEKALSFSEALARQ